VPGVAVHYALPTGATARFTATHATTADATTDAGGWADVGTLQAGGTPGALPVTVSAPGLSSLTIPLTVSAGTLAVQDAQVVEGNRGTTTVAVHVTLDRAPAAVGAVTVGYYTQGWSALAGEDFRAAFGTVTFKTRKTTATIMVKIVGDRVVEPDETLNVVLRDPNGATIATGSDTVTIVNDD
jgi:hypothetical protein